MTWILACSVAAERLGKMPIIMKDYQWTESETRLDLSLPQKGIRSNKIDVMVTNLYVKVSWQWSISEIINLIIG